MRNRSFVVVLLVGVAALTLLGSGRDVPITAYLSDYDASNNAYYIQSDAQGAYLNGSGGVQNVLLASATIPWANWQMSLLSSTTRTTRVSFCNATTVCPANAVQPGSPHYTVPANPPYWGTQYGADLLQIDCAPFNLDMLTMKPGNKFDCKGNIQLPKVSRYTYYLLAFGGTGAPETQLAQVACNSSGSDGNCNDWFIDPIPVVNADGSTSPGQTVMRLYLMNTQKTGSSTNEGDFYMTYHFHLTRP